MNEYWTKRGWAGVTSLTAGVIVALGSMSIAISAAAQTQTPLTMAASEQTADAPAAPAGQSDTSVMLIGDATHTMLALQRGGQSAAPAQPMLGAEATAAYARYLKSFDQPIPAHLDSSVGTVGGAQN
jgi:Protein of unknown function (DUF3613)